jgi:hypothetical protein
MAIWYLIARLLHNDLRLEQLADGLDLRMLALHAGGDAAEQYGARTEMMPPPCASKSIVTQLVHGQHEQRVYVSAW